MYTRCLGNDKEKGECSSELVNSHSEATEKPFDFQESFNNNKLKKIPIKIILSENEEIASTQNNTEPTENNYSGNYSPSPLQNLTESFIKFSDSNINNFKIGKLLFFKLFFLNRFYILSRII